MQEKGRRFRRAFLAVQRRVSAPTLLSPIHCGVNAELTPLSDSIAGVVETAEAFLELRVLRCNRDRGISIPSTYPDRVPNLSLLRGGIDDNRVRAVTSAGRMC